MAFTDAQIRQLAGKLNEKFVKTRAERGMTLSYIEAWHAIDEANRVFGFEGWDRETLWAECVWADARRDPKACSYAVRVRIRVRAGDAIVSRDGSGVGHGTGLTLGEAHESALKEAETDATKRALTTFGNLFGLALYDKAQNGVRRAPKPNGAAKLVWTLVSGTGDLLSRFDTPQDFCAGLRRAIEGADTPEELDLLWLRNTAAVEQMRTVCPELKTGQGLHFAAVLERIYRDRLPRLRAAPTEIERNPSVDKSELALGAPKRLRDAAHRQFVASLPCLICGRSPSQAHHLRFAQPRSLGSKVSDEWTVPLCSIHHRALHDIGDEEKWWAEQGIDPKPEAERLWRQSRAEPGPPAASAEPDRQTGSG
jgi:DNA recombination protein Rad52